MSSVKTVQTKSKKLEEESEMELAEELYNTIDLASYCDAVNVTKNISSRGHGDIITGVVDKLSQEGNLNLLSYVYQLWQSDQSDVIVQYMPKTFQTIFNDLVTLKQIKFGLPLKLDVNIDRDRIVWGDANDKTIRRISWKMIPIWKDNRVVFHIQNFEYSMFLKLEVISDVYGMSLAFGSEGSDTARHEWLLKPIVIDGDVFFYIINREYNQGLKLAESIESCGDRKLLGHIADFHCQSTHYAWSIKGLINII